MVGVSGRELLCSWCQAANSDKDVNRKEQSYTVPFKSSPPLTQLPPLRSTSKRFHHPSPPRNVASLWGHSASVLFQSLKSRIGTSGPVRLYPWILDRGLPLSPRGYYVHALEIVGGS